MSARHHLVTCIPILVALLAAEDGNRMSERECGHEPSFRWTLRSQQSEFTTRPCDLNIPYSGKAVGEPVYQHIMVLHGTWTSTSESQNLTDHTLYEVSAAEVVRPFAQTHVVTIL